MKPSKSVSRLCARIRSNSGETMVETLVSVLISALALLLLATAIGTSVNIVKMSRQKMQKLYAAESNALVRAVASGETVTPPYGSITSEIPLVDGAGSSISVNAYKADDGTFLYYEKS